MSSDERNYYDLLGVPSDASADQIKEAYREIARIYHPDSNFYSDIISDELQEDDSDLFKSVTAAYNVLVNQDRRKEYDDSLSTAMGGAPGWDSESESPSSSARRGTKTEISKEWQKERDYFEENYHEILKPGPKINLTGTGESEVAPIPESLEGWDDPDSQISGFGTLSDRVFEDPRRPPPIARRPSSQFQWTWFSDPFNLILLGIPVVGAVVLIEIIMFLA